MNDFQFVAWLLQPYQGGSYGEYQTHTINRVCMLAGVAHRLPEGAYVCMARADVAKIARQAQLRIYAQSAS
jgi:hypothetical protein